MSLAQEFRAFEEVPLHDTRAEEALLGWMLRLKGPKLKQILEQVRAEWFYLDAHRAIYPHIQAIGIELGDCDGIVLRDRLIKHGDLEAVGDESKIQRLAEMALFVPAAAETALYVVRENWRLRLIDRAGFDLRQMVRSGDEPGRIIASAKKALEAAFSGDGRELIDIADVDLESEDGKESGVPTGFASIDAFNGYLGFVTGQTSVVSAYHKGGKSAFMLQCAKALIEKEKTVVYATFADLTAAQLKRRILKQMCGMSRSPDDLFDQEIFDDALAFLNDAFRNGALKIYVGAVHGRTVEDLSAKMLEFSGKTPVDALFVDYAQKLRSRERGARDNKTAEIEYASDALKVLAEDVKCSVILGSQITRGDRGGDQTTKYARAIEEDAGLVLNIGDIGTDDRVTITVKWNRFGPSNVDVPFRWNRKLVRFEEAAV